MVRIAVVDDEADFVEVVTAILAEQGWETVPYEPTRTLFSCLQQQLPDVILLDLWLAGGHSGWDLLAALRHDPLLHRIPVVLCSGAKQELEPKEAWLREQGITWLAKPFDIETLYALVEQVLSPARGQAVGHLAS